MDQNIFKQKGLSLDRLATFVKVAKFGGIMKAAGGDGSTQSLYSRQIKDLETFLGTPLLTRSKKGSALTPSGEELNAIASEFFRAIETLHHQAHQIRTPILIESGNTFFEWFLLPNLKKLQSINPGWKLELAARETSQIVKNLIAMRCDMAICREQIGLPEHLVQIPLTKMSHELCIPLELAQKMESQTLKLAMQQGGFLREGFDKLLRQRKLNLEVGLDCRSSVQARSAMLSGAYGAILPISPFQPNPQSDQIVYLRPPWLRELGSNYVIIWNRRDERLKPEIPKIARAIRVIISQRASLPARRKE